MQNWANDEQCKNAISFLYISVFQDAWIDNEPRARNVFPKSVLKQVK